MTSVQPNDALVKDLVAQFIEIGIAQYDAIYFLKNHKYKRLYTQMKNIRDQLRQMPGDQRGALLPLLDHSNVQVRLMAAKSLLAIAPEFARRALEAVMDSGIQPQCADASGMIGALNEGAFIPK